MCKPLEWKTFCSPKIWFNYMIGSILRTLILCHSLMQLDLLKVVSSFYSLPRITSPASTYLSKNWTICTSTSQMLCLLAPRSFRLKLMTLNNMLWWFLPLCARSLLKWISLTIARCILYYDRFSLLFLEWGLQILSFWRWMISMISKIVTSSGCKKSYMAKASWISV